ncbi:MAG: glycoside hydrolase family 88 protein [Clostridia bacterium]|nr:glycoside hydrolase family 88 protein [Clostridia bacterium]
MTVSILEKVKKATLSMQRYSWEQGVVAQAFLESGDTEEAILLAVEGAHRQLPDGRCAHIGDPGAVTDPCCIGEALLLACDETGAPFLQEAKEKLLKWAILDAPRTRDGIVYHVTFAPEIWVDSFYMLPPFLAKAGYCDEAIKQIEGYWQLLLDPEKNLLSHRFNAQTGIFPRKDVWGVGNGWALAGMTRVLRALPENKTKEKESLRQKITVLLNAALPLQMENGMFHDVLDDEGTFPEVNFGQMLAYTVYSGVKDGWLDEKYLPCADKARAAAIGQVDRFGLVQNVCGMPDFDRPFVAPEGQAFFILMEAAHAALMP